MEANIIKFPNQCHADDKFFAFVMYDIAPSLPNPYTNGCTAESH